jgi:hypothetical protein
LAAWVEKLLSVPEVSVIATVIVAKAHELLAAEFYFRMQRQFFPVSPPRNVVFPAPKNIQSFVAHCC